MDFIEPLPPSSGFDSILVIVDRLTKQAIFIPITIHCTSEDLAMLFIIHVFSKHGVPKHVTSDRGSEFVSVCRSGLVTGKRPEKDRKKTGLEPVRTAN